MPRYIDADKAPSIMKEMPMGKQVIDAVMKMVIDRLPTEDVVEVVRCKDCVHHDDCICVVCEEGETVVCKRESRHVRKDFSCIYGKRSESNGRE